MVAAPRKVAGWVVNCTAAVPSPSRTGRQAHTLDSRGSPYLRLPLVHSARRLLHSAPSTRSYALTAHSALSLSPRALSKSSNPCAFHPPLLQSLRLPRLHPQLLPAYCSLASTVPVVRNAANGVCERSVQQKTPGRHPHDAVTQSLKQHRRARSRRYFAVSDCTRTAGQCWLRRLGHGPWALGHVTVDGFSSTPQLLPAPSGATRGQTIRLQ